MTPSRRPTRRPAITCPGRYRPPSAPAEASLQPATRLSAWVWLLVALGASLVVRLPFLGLPIISDEGGYAYVTRHWLDGTGRLYHDVWVSRPQGIFVAYALIMETIGSSAAALRLGAWVFAAGTLVVVWRFALAWRGEAVAAVAALLFAVLSASPTIEGFTANAEVFMALPAAGAALLLLWAGTRGWGAGTLLMAGACAGLAAQLKPSGVVMLGVGLAYVWLLEPRTGPALRRSGLLLAGFAAALAPAVAHGWWLGWGEFLFAAVTYRLGSQSSATAGLDHQFVQLSTLLTRCALELTLLALALAAYHGRWPRLAALRGGVERELTRAGRLGVVGLSFGLGRVAPGTLLLRLWFLGGLAGVAMGGDWWAHYLVQLAAPFAIWVARLLVGAWSRLDGVRRRALVAIAFVAVLGPYAVVAEGDPDAIGRAVFGQPQYEHQDEIAAYLREHAPPDATILVAFDHPAVYYLAERKAAYRYMFDQEIEAIPAAYGELLDLITGVDRPLYVVAAKEPDAPYPDQGRAFWDAVTRHYHIVDTVRGVPILREDDGLGRGR